MKNLNLLLLGIFILGVFFRFYQFGQIPAGLTNDEADIGYDAYSVLKTGSDQWGEFLPITSFRGFGDFRPVAYTYFIVPFIPLFDLNSVSVRLPSAIAGSLSILAIYFLVKKLFDEKSALFSSLILAVSPWSIGLSRIGVESNVAMFFTIISLLFLLNIKKSTKYLFLGLFFLALTVYTYSAYFIFSFLVLLAVAFYHRKELIKQRKVAALGILFFLLLLSPVLLNSLTAKTRFSQVGLTTNVNSVGIVQVLNDTRGHCQKSYPQLVCKVVNNKPFVFTSEFFKNYLSHFSPSFLYITGSTSQFSILPARGLGFMFEVVFLLAGLLSIFHAKKREGYLVLTLLLLSPIPDSITGSGNYSRASLMLPFLIITEGVGFAYIISRIVSLKHRVMRNGALILGGSLIVLSVVSFFISYTSYFKNYYSSYSQYGYKELTSEIDRNKEKYDKIYVSRNINDAKQYIYYLFFSKYHPESFQNKSNVSYNTEDGGWVNVSRIDNIYFVPNISSIEKSSKLLDEKVLFFAHPSEFPDKIDVVKDIKDLAGTTVFREIDINALRPFIKEDEK